MKMLNYEAHAGLGVIFPAKTFIVEGQADIYVISPGPLNDETVKELRSAQKTLHFIAPNNVHHLHLKKAKELFPDSNFYGPRRSMDKSGLSLMPLSELPGHDLQQFKIEGNKAMSETAFHNKHTNELILTDLIFNMRHEMNFVTKLVFKMAGVYHKVGTSRLIKMTIDNKKQFKQSLEQLLTLNPSKVYLNHGDAISGEVFRRHIESLTR